MKTKLNLILAVLICCTFLSNIHAQTCGERYKDRYFTSVQKFEDVVYSRDAPGLLSASLGIETTLPNDLVMDIYMPPPNDPVQNRPAVILAHGGGFINVAFMGGTVLVGTKNNEDVQALADSLAHRGFVTASIEYRTGFDILSQTSVKRAVWRGAQDMSAAVRFFRKNASWFGVDTNRVFIGGSSAGAFCALHSTFVDYGERIPESYQVTPVVMQDLGDLHSRPVEELTSFNPFAGNSVLADDVDSLATGVVAFWGAIADTLMLHGSNSAPTIMFHGTDDLIVNHQCAKPFSGVVLVAPVSCGSTVMDSIMTAQGVQHEYYPAPGEGHEYWGALNGDWTPTGPNAYFADMIQKTSDFFYGIMQAAPPTISGATVSGVVTPTTYSVVNPDPNATYCWEVDQGTIVSPTTNGSSVDVLWYNQGGNGFASIRAKEVDAANVASNWGNLNVLTSTEKLEDVQHAFRLYPNPAENQITIDFEYTIFSEAQIEIHNMLGQSIIQKEQMVEAGFNQFTLDTKMLEKGLYVVSIQIQDRIIQKSFVKE